jgi:hypothetical protein
MLMVAAPTDDCIDSTVREAEPAKSSRLDRRNASIVHDGVAIPDFTLSVFARPIALLTTDPDTRAKLEQSQLNLSRPELDRGLSRDAFWCDAVAPAFHNKNVSPSLDMRGQVDEADSSAPPLISRLGNFLTGQYYSVKSHFTEAHRRWDLSGQLQSEAASFLSFCPTRRGTSGISNAGKRMMILFVALKYGTPYEDVEMLSMVLKLANPDRIYDVGTSERRRCHGS